MERVPKHRTSNIKVMRRYSVTVIIPAYNASRYLSETVQSAYAANPERIVIVNDGSTDETLEIATRLSSALDSVEVVNQPNSGESAAINSGLAVNTSKYVLFLSADDLISETLLSRATRELEAKSEIVAIYPSWKKIDSNGREIGEVTDISFSYERLIGNLECLPGPGSVIRASSLGIGRLENLTQMADFEQWIRLSGAGKLVHIDEVLASWRQHDRNMSLMSYGSKNSIELDVIRKQVEVTLDRLSIENKNLVRESFLSTWHKLKAISEVRAQGSNKSASHLLSSLSILRKNREVKLKNGWTPIEVVSCLLPRLARAWFSLTSRIKSRR